MTTVLHLMIGWGAPSQTFVANLVLGVPGYEPVVVCEELESAPPPGLRVRTIGGLLRRLPTTVAGKAAIATTALFGRRRRAAVVHAHFGHEVLLAVRTARMLRRPLVVALHGRDLLVELAGEHLRAVQSADAVVVPSPFLADAAIAKGIAAERIAVIPSGIELDTLPFTERRLESDEVPLVLFIGRFVAKKGVIDAATAVTRVAATRAVRARFIGSGPLEADLRAALAPLGDNAEVVDGRDRASVQRGLADAHVLISPSRTADDGDAETLLVVNLEAQAAGLPVLTTRHGGIPYGVDPDAAVLVPEADVVTLAAALDRLVAADHKWPAMGRAGRRWVEDHFSLTLARTRTARLYDSLIAGHGVPADLRAGAGTPDRATNPST